MWLGTSHWWLSAVRWVQRIAVIGVSPLVILSTVPDWRLRGEEVGSTLSIVIYWRWREHSPNLLLLVIKELALRMDSRTHIVILHVLSFEIQSLPVSLSHSLTILPSLPKRPMKPWMRSFDFSSTASSLSPMASSLSPTLWRRLLILLRRRNPCSWNSH